jgi:hypothetical protein
MVDELIPNFAPEAYSQGVGTGSAQVFDLGAPNPFQVAGNTYENLLAINKDKLKTSYENEQKRQEKLDEFLSSMEDYDNAWAVGQQILSDKINTYGDSIAGMRAQGKAIDVTSLNKSKKEISDLAKANEANQKKYAEIASIMSDPIVYTDEERKKFEEEVKANAKVGYTSQEDNGIMKTQGYLDNWRKSLATPDLAVDYLKIKPTAKDDKTGRIKATNEAEARTVVVDNVWAGYEDIQKKKLLSEMIQHGQIDATLVEAAKKQDGSIDFNNEALKKSVGDALFTKIRPYLEFEKTPAPVYSGGGGGSGSTKQDQFNYAAQAVPGFSTDEMRKISLGDPKGGGVEARLFQTRKSGKKNIIPYYMEYLNEEQAKSSGNQAGWYVFGKESKEDFSKEIKPGESEESLIADYASKNGMNANDVEYKRDGDKIKFYKLVDAIAPYDLNVSELKLYGINSLEDVARQQGFSKIAGGSQAGGGGASQFNK